MGWQTSTVVSSQCQWQREEQEEEREVQKNHRKAQRPRDRKPRLHRAHQRCVRVWGQGEKYELGLQHTHTHTHTHTHAYTHMHTHSQEKTWDVTADAEASKPLGDNCPHYSTFPSHFHAHHSLLPLLHPSYFHLHTLHLHTHHLPLHQRKEG